MFAISSDRSGSNQICSFVTIENVSGFSKTMVRLEMYRFLLFPRRYVLFLISDKYVFGLDANTGNIYLFHISIQKQLRFSSPVTY